MSIKSHAFGRVTLTGQDAKKFRNQVSHGRPTAAAVQSVRSGIKLAREYEKSGKVSLTLKAPSK
jgi:hypothetical protein